MKRCFSVLLIIIILSGMSIVSFAIDRTILALGDSISAGYGLDDREAECYVSLMALPGDAVINKAVDGNKATDIINQLTNAENENHISVKDIEKADIVTITCGGNDMMALLYEKIAAEYTNVHPRKQKITADEVLGKMAEGNVYAIVAALHVLDEDDDAYYMNDGEFDIRLDAFMENLLWITDYVLDINPNVKIVVATQYNPYVEFEASTGYDVLYYGMEEGATRLNDAITENAEMGGYTVAHVKSVFDNYSGEADLYNANPDIDNINLDFHPSKAGHEVIAEVFDKLINNVHRLGTRNPDGTYSLPENVLGYYITTALGEVRLVDAGIYEAEDGDRVEAVNFNVTMAQGAQVRIAGGTGLRFLATVDRSNFDADAYGMKITAEGSTKETIVDAEKWQDDTTFSVALTDMAESNYVRKFTATPYVKVTYDDGTEKTIYGTGAVTRSIYQVAAGLLKDETQTAYGLSDVLNAYANQTGLRLVVHGGELKANTDYTAKGAYNLTEDELHFAVSDAAYDSASNSYSVILTAQGNAEIITDNNFWYDYIRINNNNSLVKDKVTVERVEGNDKAVKVTFMADGLIERPADSSDNTTPDDNDDGFDSETGDFN